MISNVLINPGFRIWQRGTAFDVYPDSNKYIYTADQWVVKISSGVAAKICRGEESRYDQFCMDITAEPNTVMDIYQAPEIYTPLKHQCVTFGIDVKFLTSPRALFMFLEQTTNHSTIKPQTSLKTYEIKEGFEPLSWSRHYITVSLGNLISNPDWPNYGGVRVGVMLLADNNTARVLIDGASLQLGQNTGSYETLSFQEDLERCQRYYGDGGEIGPSMLTLPQTPAEGQTLYINNSSGWVSIDEGKEKELSEREAALAAREAELAKKEAKYNQTEKPVDFGKSKRIIDI